MRSPRSGLVALRWESETGQTQHGVAHLAGISQSGASVRTQRAVRVGTKLSLGYQNKVKEAVRIREKTIA